LIKLIYFLYCSSNATNYNYFLYIKYQIKEVFIIEETNDEDQGPYFVFNNV